LARLVPLTRRGWTVLVAAIGLYAVGLLAGYVVFRALAGVAVGAVIAAILLTSRPPRVEVRRDLYPDRVERGRPALATLRVRNAGSRWQAALSAWDVAGEAREQVAVRRLAPGAEATYRYELPTTRRGLLPVGPLVLERSDPLGLARHRLSAGGSTTLWVHPKRHAAGTAIAGRPRHHHEGRTTDDSLRGSADLRDVRPYVVGDEVRHLHWKVTARTGQLMVRDYVDPDQPRLNILLDTRLGVLPEDGFEEAVEVAASLAFGAAMAAHRCRLLTPEGLDLVPPAGPVAARMMLDTLTEVAQSSADTPLLPSVLTSGRSGGGTFAVVTGPMRGGRELAPLVARFHPVTVVVIDPEEKRPGGSSERVRWIVARNAVAAVRQWNVEA
jgi:uncharacterized protein (DUF58 family)